MSLLQMMNEMKVMALNTPMVSMSSYGDIQKYNHKSNIWYPYVNFDILRESVRGGAVYYTLRVYVADRNPDEYTSYSKCRLILSNILKHPQLEVQDYSANYFKMDFLDLCHGVWTDVTIEKPLVMECYTDWDMEGGRIKLEDTSGYVVTQDGDYVKIEDNNQVLPGDTLIR